MLTRKIWQVHQMPSESPGAAVEGFDFLQSALLFARGIRDHQQAQSFLYPDTPINHDPFQLSGMEEAVAMILESLAAERRICIYADYDADGITSASLLSLLLREYSKDVDVYFPDRFTEGYGLNTQAVEELASRGVELLITVDCGIRGVREVELARKLAMNVIVTDHHLPGGDLPNASVILNPRLPGDGYPFKDLAGVGLAYKLGQGLSENLKTSVPIESYLDLVAIGTVADIVPLIDENRHFVQQGLDWINQKPRPGIEALMTVAGASQGTVDAAAIGFRLAPRINAAGRLGSARRAFELLIEQNAEQAQAFAEKLDRMNSERQNLTHEILKAMEENPPNASDKIIFSFASDYHPGVVGLAASRSLDRFYRPSIVGTIDEHTTRASARSIPGFNITSALEACSDLLSRFGGHSAAAGFTVDNEKREHFVDRFLHYANENIDDEMLQPYLDIDTVIGFEAIDRTLMSFLDRLEPFGHQNSQPIFCTPEVRVLSKRTVGRDSSHLKLTLEHEGKPFDAIAFRMGELAAQLPEKIEAAFHIERNVYMGYESLQLRVVDLRENGSMRDEQRTRWLSIS
jgi:single-stranded-DNA-specific exonuclease